MRNNVAFEDDFLKGSGYALEILTKIFNKNPNKNRNKSPSLFILHSSFFILSLPFLQELDERIDILVVTA